MIEDALFPSFILAPIFIVLTRLINMFIHPLQLFTIAIMFCPGLWVAPPRPPDVPPRSRGAVIAYKVIGGLALSQIIWITPPGGRCARDSLCDIAQAHRSILAQSGLHLGLATPPRPSPAPVSERYTSSLLRTTCPFVIIPPRPAPTCRNTDVHPTFEWAPQSPMPLPVPAQRSCLPSPIPIVPGDERTYIHPSIAPYPLPRPTDVAPISCVLPIVVLISCAIFVRHILAIMCAALVVSAKFMVRVGDTLPFMDAMKALYKGEQHNLHLVLVFVNFVVKVINNSRQFYKDIMAYSVCSHAITLCFDELMSLRSAFQPLSLPFEFSVDMSMRGATTTKEEVDPEGLVKVSSIFYWFVHCANSSLVYSLVLWRHMCPQS